ncbi:MAG: RNA polymerase sigma-70 factor (ECF subfamily) [Rhodothermales bacterium]|jgi:RNA polymerase sigma-70 factor (ECF subfamily)
MLAVTQTLVMDRSSKREADTLIDFGTLVEKYKRGILVLAYDLTGNHHDAEDLAQEVFIKAHRGLAGFRGESGIYAWLHRIAVNAHLNKKRKKALSFMRLMGDVEGTDTWSEPGPTPNEDAEGSDTRAHIDRALDVLAPRERTAFVMRHYHELSTKEVADAMGIADGTVKSLVFRATSKLRDSLHFLRHDA